MLSMNNGSHERRAEHTAALYRSDDFIVERVALFIAEGLALREQVLVVCTLAHWNTIGRRLDRSGVPYGRATSDGRLVFVDAEAVLDTITKNGTISADRFGAMLHGLLKPTAKARVYGEVVSLLAQRGDIDAAIEIELLGQQLAHTRGIPVLCGYHVDGADKLSEEELARICEVHDRSSAQRDSESTISSASAVTRGEGHFHAVRFYQDRDSLARIVARFLGEGFVAASPAVVIATREHREAISRALTEQFFDVARLERASELIMVDADATLSEFMVEGMPHPGRFEETVSPLLERASHGRSNSVVYAYGEMVDVLWKAEQTVAAVRLETLWNQLAQSQAFALLCGYSMGHFYKDAAQRTICAQHTHIISDTGQSAVLH
jgi:MEDS: MEthanogen/methylotroph, DcmR Sensory domain